MHVAPPQLPQAAGAAYSLKLAAAPNVVIWYDESARNIRVRNLFDQAPDAACLLQLFWRRRG